MEILHYKDLHGFESKCGLTIYTYKDKTATVIFTELKDNPGTSVTNFIEHLATMVYNSRLKDCNPNSITWVEHHPKRGSFEETYDRVYLEWDGERFGNPRWERIATEEDNNL